MSINEETRRKMSESQKGRKHSKKTRLKISQSNIGKHNYSEEIRRKIGEAHKGILHSEEQKRKISKTLKKIGAGKWNIGKKHSKIHNKKVSEALKGRIFSEETRRKLSKSKKGSNNPSWKGGITSEIKRIRHSIDIKLWREAVFKRYNFTCQKYGIKGGKLIAHHIQNFADFPDLRFAIDNGITLSDKAHREFHKKYGRKNNTREQLEEFLEEKNG